jgi:23S rRNA (uracil1939-C5)-methyltransferase
MTGSTTTEAAGRELDLEVSAVAYGGKGIGREAPRGAEPCGQGKVWFVRGAVEGDRVRAKVTSDSGRYGDADLVELLRPSPARGEALCKHAGTCGGCDWQGIAYEQQLAWKKSFVTSALTRIGKLPKTVEVTAIGAPSPVAYRNRVLVRAHHHEGESRLRLGYFQRGTHVLAAIESCAIAHPALNRTIAALRELDVAALAPFTVRIEIQALPLLADAAATEAAYPVVLTAYPGSGSNDAIRALVTRAREAANVAWAGLVFDLKRAPTFPFDTDLGRTFPTQPGQFQQVNVAMNRVLRRLVAEHADAVHAERVLDVCCGSGNLSLPLADGARYVEGVEANAAAISSAAEAVKAQGLQGAVYIAGDAERHLWKCARGGERFDLIILDPPRQGMREGMVPLKKIAAAHVVYVGCDPTTLARDVSYLTRGDEYVIDRVVALDFFPNTYHVETVAFLRRP